MAHCTYCQRDLPGDEKVCAACYQKEYDDKFGTPKPFTRRLGRFFGHNWVWLLLAIINIPAFVMFPTIALAKFVTSIQDSTPHWMKAATDWSIVIALWTEWFLIPISIYLALMLNSEVPRQFRGWSWLVVGSAIVSISLGLRMMR